MYASIIMIRESIRRNSQIIRNNAHEIITYQRNWTQGSLTLLRPFAGDG